jgi:hypothetical protein
VLLSDRDPVPLAAVGVLRVVLERNGAFSAVVQRLGLLPRLLALLDPASAGRSRQALLLARALVESPEADLPALHALGLAPRVAAVVVRAVADGAADLYEPALDVAAAVLHRAVAALRDADTAPSPPPGGEAGGDAEGGGGEAAAAAVLATHEPLLDAAPALARLCALDLPRPGRAAVAAPEAAGELPAGPGPADVQVVESASLCLLLLSHLYPAHVLLPASAAPDGDPTAAADGLAPSPAACVAAGLLCGGSTVRKRLLKTVLAVAGGAADPDAVLPALYELYPAVEELAGGGGGSSGPADEAVADLAGQALASIQALGGQGRGAEQGGGSGAEEEYHTDGFDDDA